MNGKDFNEVVELICRQDSRYPAEAYHFIRAALDHTLKAVAQRERMRGSRHVTGQELCEGVRDFVLEQYGPMSLTLLHQWGMRRTEDFGELVYNLVDFGVFGKTESDSRDDFVAIFDFEEAFAAPFRPQRLKVPPLKLGGRARMPVRSAQPSPSAG